MKFLRLILLLYAIFCLFSGITLFFKGGFYFFVGLILLTNFIVLVSAAFFEGRYKPKNTLDSGWQKTGEKFVDEKSGKTIEVEFNPKTGERKYN